MDYSIRYKGHHQFHKFSPDDMTEMDFSHKMSTMQLKIYGPRLPSNIALSSIKNKKMIVLLIVTGTLSRYKIAE